MDFLPFDSVVGFPHLKALGFQHHGYGFHQIRIVVDNQYVLSSHETSPFMMIVLPL